MPSSLNLNVNPSDLAGLTPENIASVVGAKQTQDRIMQESYSNILKGLAFGDNLAHTRAQTANLQSEVNERTPRFDIPGIGKVNGTQYMAWLKMEKEGALDKPFPVDVPGVGSVSTRQWTALPESDREYSLASFQARKMGDNNFMSKDEWLLTKPTDREKFVRAAMADPKLKSVAMELARAGAFNLGDFMKKEEAGISLKGEKYFADPNWTKDLQHYIGSKDIQNRISDVQVPVNPTATKEEKASAYKNAVSKERAKVTMEFITGKIAAAGGKVLQDTVHNDGKTVTWKVQWPSGNVTEVTQPVR